MFGSIADFAALSFAAQSLIAPLGALTIVSNVVFAPYLLGEKISQKELLGTATIIFGSVIAVAFADHQSQPHRSLAL